MTVKKREQIQDNPAVSQGDKSELPVNKRLYTRLMDVFRRRSVKVPLLNPAARTALRLKVHYEEAVIRAFARNRIHEIEAWFDRTPVFFGFALFRSGTTFLATFLNEVCHDVLIEHEANVNDYWYYHKALQSERNALAYVSQFRLNEIYYRVHGQSIRGYGEINPFLRRHCVALQQRVPGARFFHLVRDGRDVVRSIMSREILDKTDPFGHLTLPPPGDPFRDRWRGMSRFEKVCWLWTADNRYLREKIGHSVVFEKLVGDYSYFKDELMDKLDLEVPESLWTLYTDRLANRTPKYRMKHWRDWRRKEKEIFNGICGEEMEAYGYGPAE